MHPFAFLFNWLVQLKIVQLLYKQIFIIPFVKGVFYISPCVLDFTYMNFKKINKALLKSGVYKKIRLLVYGEISRIYRIHHYIFKTMDNDFYSVYFSQDKTENFEELGEYQSYNFYKLAKANKCTQKQQKHLKRTLVGSYNEEQGKKDKVTTVEFLHTDQVIKVTFKSGKTSHYCGLMPQFEERGADEFF